MKPAQPLRKPKRFVEQKLRKFSPRGLLLYLLPSPLIVAVIIALAKGNLWSILVNTSGFAVYILAAWCLRKGLATERLLANDRFAARPKWRFKLTAAMLLSLATFWVAWQGALQPLSLALVYAAGAFLGMFLSYGFDARQTVTTQAAQGYSGKEIFKALEESAGKIHNIEQANEAIANQELNQRIERICTIAASILADIEADPKDFRRARKFLNVYLDGAQKVTEGYAKTHSSQQSGELEQNFRNVLETIETVFQEQKQKLLEDDVFDLDVKIEVLNNQLKQDGIL